jgi:hypothetical protein
MSYLPKPTEGGDFVLPPEGTHPALLYRLIDLGTQITTYKGEQKIAHQILLGWELKGDETIMEDGRPMSMHKRYTWSMHEKASLRKALEAWRGAKFQEKDFGPGGFDTRNLIGKSCLLSIVHEEKGDKTYANIVSVSKLPKGMTAGSLINDAVYLWLSPEGFDKAVFEKLSDSLKATIAKSPEYQDLIGGKSRGGGKPLGDDDEIPF